jgi:hypothetical protein
LPDVTVYEKTLYHSPIDIEFLSATPDIINKGEKTKVQFTVHDIGFDGNTLPTPLPQLVKFESHGKIESSEGAFGIASKGVVTAWWTPESKRDILYARLYNKDGEIISEAQYGEKAEIPVNIVEFKQTDAKYERDGYRHNGETYSFEYDVAVTVELTDNLGVDDWGYVYEDLNGNITHISLKDFSSPYTDTRYVYYRNNAKSFVRLYGYVKFNDSDFNEYGDPIDFEVNRLCLSCPDDQHPHMIDLGLPDGTLWSCCNVGASCPEEFGYHYAWGETYPKSVFSTDTYQYCYTDDNGETHYQYLGKDISGTVYDAAHANWGNSWRMPNDSEAQQLKSLTRDRVTINGVKGMLYTGLSGNTIFIPESGSIWGTQTYYNEVSFWTSSYVPAFWYSETKEGSAAAFVDRIYEDGHFVDSYYAWRIDGYTIRPIYNK